MAVIGVSHTVHGSAAALVDQSGIVSAAVEERFNRQKYSAEFPTRATDYCLGEGRVTLEELDGLAYFMSASNFLPQLSKQYSERLRFYPEAYYSFPNNVLPRVTVESAECVEQVFRFPSGRRARFYYVDHHLCHAAEAFSLSPFTEAAILTLDGRGDGVCAMFAVGRGDTITPLKRVPFPHSVGQFYSAFTQFLGFTPNRDEYKVMGLAAYGKAERFYNQVRPLVRLSGDGTFEIDLTYFSYFVSSPARFSPKFVAAFGEPRSATEPITERHMDVAASVQLVLEEAVLHMARALQRLTGLSALCYGGGVALNSLANGRLLRDTPFTDLSISSSPDDSGTCRGAAAYVHAKVFQRPLPRGCRHDYLGPGWETEEISKFLDDAGVRYEALADPSDAAAHEIAAGKIVGWFQGRMEFGPRALGNRSILADPRRPEMPDIVNGRVKFRERFRPFAPSVTAEAATRYFDVPDSLLRIGAPTDFMVYVCPVRESARGTIPAVTHVDGSARVQIVHDETNLAFSRLLRAFESRTGLPVVLNTSFNLNEEPIVCSPADALRTFMTSGIDCLFLDQFLLRK